MEGDPKALITAYLGSLRNPSPRTLDTYSMHLRPFAAWCVEQNLTVDQCTRQDIQRWLYTIQQRLADSTTRSSRRSTVRRFYGWATAEGHIATDPTTDLIGKEVRSPPRQHFLSVDDLRRLVRAAIATHPSDAAVVLLFAALGLPVQEVERLSVEDYRRTSSGATLTTRRVSVTRTHQLPPLLAETLDQLVEGRTHGPLLLNMWGKARMDRAAVSRVLDRIAAVAGVEPTPSPSDVVSSMRYIAMTEGFSFVEVVRAMPGKTMKTLLDSVNSLPPAKRPASFRMVSLLRPDHDSNAALLDQADALRYADAHPAVRVMLAGAVLERHMRLLANEHHSLQRPPSKPDGTGITTWTGPLTGAKVLSTEESANAQFVADRRNEAAHGHFDLITDSIAEDVIGRTRGLLDAHPLAPVVRPEPERPTPAPRRPRKTAVREPREPRPVQPREGRRDAIPDMVKMYVWQRDNGACVRCGSNMNLEYDHIIPRVMGGSDTARNLQLLCAMCNRSKGGNIV